MKEGQSLDAWLKERHASVPQELRDRIENVIETTRLQFPEHTAEDVLVRAARERLNALLASDSKSRGAALDLLATDALITYAVEAVASKRPGVKELDALAEGMIKIISAIQPPSPDSSKSK